MQGRDDLCALAHRRGDAFDRARADIADREHAWATCLQQATIAAGLSAGQHKSFTVKRYAGSGEPIRVRIRSDEEEQVADRPPYFFTDAPCRQRTACNMPSTPSRPLICVRVSTSTLERLLMRSTR